jgi:hypothetical protein
MHLIGRTICFLLVIALSGCSMLTKQGRQQRAYEKYVRKSSYTQAKRAVKFRISKINMPPLQSPSEPTMETSVSDSPQSVSSSDAPQNQ